MNCEHVSVNGRVTPLSLMTVYYTPYSMECVCGQKKVYCGLTMAKGGIRGTDQCACESTTVRSERTVGLV